MQKRIGFTAIGLLIAAGLTLAAPAPKSGTWTGWVTDTQCGARGQSESHAACAKKCVAEHGAKFALYNSADQKVYVLNPQDQAEAHAGHHVQVEGTIEGDTITATSITTVSESGGKK